MSTKKLQLIGAINADTLDGKHADEFALATNVEELQSALESMDENVAQKSQVQIITWEDDD